jgi:hypothetical protein
MADLTKAQALALLDYWAGAVPQLEPLRAYVAAAPEDTARLDAVEENQWRPECVEYRAWLIKTGFDGGGQPRYAHGTTVREAIDAARTPAEAGR